ncbi:hypothetical protein [Qipengyuania sp. SM2507]
MTDTPDTGDRFDKFSMPCDIPDSGPPFGPDHGVPTQDWLSRGLRHKAGRGWEADDGVDARADTDLISADPATNPAYTHYPSSAAYHYAQLQAQRGAQGRGVRSAQPLWPAGWLPGDPPVEIVLDADGWADPADHNSAAAKFGPPQQVRFLDALATHGNVRAAAARVGVSRETIYRTRRREPAFANLWDAALVHARSACEAELATRALDGVATPVFVRGEHVATWRRHDPRYLLGHLARLDRRIAAGGQGEREAQARAQAEARAERFDDMLAALAGQPAPEDHARAAAIGARMAWEDYEAGGREAGEPAPAPPCADLPPTRMGVFGLACEQALDAQEAAVAAGKKDYRDAAARGRADDRAVERATTKAVARWEQWQADGRALLDRVLAGAGDGERDGAEDGGEDGDEGVTTTEAARDARGVPCVSDVSDGPELSAAESSSGADRAGTVGACERRGGHPRTRSAARKASTLGGPLAATMVASLAGLAGQPSQGTREPGLNWGGGAGSLRATPASVSSAVRARPCRARG